jgi:uncharacterized membrane protein YbhN (UPF0104 family)
MLWRHLLENANVPADDEPADNGSPYPVEQVTPSARATPRSVTRRPVLGLLIGLTIAATVFMVSKPALIWEGLQEVDLWPLTGALLLNVPIVLLRALRAQVSIRLLGHRISLRSMIPVQLVGQTSSTVTPAASGDYVRAYMWRRLDAVPVRDGAAVVTYERLFSLFLLVVVIVLLIILPRHGWIGWVAVAAGLGLATLAPAAVELVTPPHLERRALRRITSGRWLGKFAEGALEMADNLRRLFRSPMLLSQTSAITIGVFILSGLQVMLVLAGLGDSVRITQAVTVYATSQVAGILSTLPFGLGAADAILVAVLSGYGVGLADSATAAVLFRAVSTLPLALAGLIAYSRVGGRSRSEPISVGSGGKAP